MSLLKFCLHHLVEPISSASILLTFVAASMLPTISFAQNVNTIFEVSDGKLTDSLALKLKEINVQQKNLYEDEKYVVRGTCSGEWGGSVWFTNKITGIEHSSAATCPVSVNRIGTRYYVTASLAHLSGSCEILEILYPDSMAVFKMPAPRKKKGKREYRYVGDDESKSTTGIHPLITSYETLVLGSFIVDDQLLHIVTKNRETFIASIKDENFQKIASITSEDIFSYETKNIKVGTHLFIPIAVGYLEVAGSRVTILRR